GRPRARVGGGPAPLGPRARHRVPLAPPRALPPRQRGASRGSVRPPLDGGHASRPRLRPRGVRGPRRRADLRDGRGARPPPRAPGARRAERRPAAERGLRALSPAPRRLAARRGEGQRMTPGDRRFDESMALLARAREVVPGASQTLSKGPAMFVEGAYPVFLERGQGCRVWDVDGNEYVDYVLGLASITLGYAYPPVVEAVARQLERGSIFSLPHPLEVEVSERLTRVIPCAEMVRFVKTGSEADAAAVRVARAATGRDVILYSGYLGWHEWYAITTPRSKGIPKDFSRLVVPFEYNDLASLDRALAEHHGRLAAVIMEPVLLDAPAPGFLAAVKALTHRHGALLIFDEIVSGFRWAVGGAQECFGV